MKTKQQNPLSFCLFLVASMISRSLQTVSCMREVWKQETYVRRQSFSSELAVKYLNLEQRKIQIYLPLGEHQSHGQCVFAISNNSHKFQRQFPPNFQWLGIPRNSEKFPLVFSPILKYSQIFQSFLCFLICISWNKLEFLGIPKTLGINSFCFMPGLPGPSCSKHG